MGFTAGRLRWARGNVDLSAKSADIDFIATVAPALLDPVSRRTHLTPQQIRRHHAEPAALNGRISGFGPGWKFSEVEGHVDAMAAGSMPTGSSSTRCGGSVSFDGRTTCWPQNATAVARSGDNLALGVATSKTSRPSGSAISCEGRLRPLEISAVVLAAAGGRAFLAGSTSRRAPPRRHGGRAGPLPSWQGLFGVWLRRRPKSRDPGGSDGSGPHAALH